MNTDHSSQFVRSATIVALLSILAGTAVADSRKTAKYLEANLEKLKGEKVSLDVTHVAPHDPGRTVEGVRFFMAYTWDTDNDAQGGTVLVAVSAGEAEDLQNRHGLTPRFAGRLRKNAKTRQLRGTLGVLPTGRIFVADGEDAAERMEAQIKAADRRKR